jgi:hypothetical protein
MALKGQKNRIKILWREEEKLKKEKSHLIQNLTTFWWLGSSIVF